LKIACIEEVAHAQGYIDRTQLMTLIEQVSPGSYRDYLMDLDMGAEARG